jgi:2,3-bisphosphoglycerate-dependent phosphoglycerate mutase
MTTRILIIRHGNTFNADEPARRVGRKTDIPLVQSGLDQANALGNYIQSHALIPDYICASELIRAQQTAQGMIESAGLGLTIHTDKTFNEIDHGVDENKTDADIIARIGKKALDDWADYGVVPDGWDVDPRAVQSNWIDFANDCLENRNGQVTCVVSSGGIIRFAPVLTGGDLPDGQTPKVKTASMGSFTHDGHAWICDFWNKRPE